MSVDTSECFLVWEESGVLAGNSKETIPTQQKPATPPKLDKAGLVPPPTYEMVDAELVQRQEDEHELYHSLDAKSRKL